MNPPRAGRRLKIIVTAGPTREKLDPVRFISNYSTGTMGYEIAREAAGRGHSVILVSGPASLPVPKGVRAVAVESALDMKKAILKDFGSADAVVMAAAVCDWRPARLSRKKIKKGRDALSLKLVENPDILSGLGRRKGRKALVGFALETEGLVRNASSKMKEKNLDFIVANRPLFGNQKSDFLIIDSRGKVSRYPHYSKKDLAGGIIDKVEALCYSSAKYEK